GDAELFHEDERDQNRDGQGKGDDENAAEVKKENDMRERHQDDFLRERMLESLDGAVNEIAPIVESFDRNSWRQAGLQLLDFVFDALDDCEGVFPGAHDDDAAYRFMAVYVEGSPSK